MAQQRYAADVIVVGAGIAGVAAALELLDRGRRVLLIDRDTEDHLGGLARESFGGIWFADTPLQRRYGIRDSAELGLRDWHAWADFGPDDRWPRAWADAYVHRANFEVFDWLRGRGIAFMPMPLWVERGLYGPGNSVPRWHVVWGTGHELQTVLNRHLLGSAKRDRLECRFGHKVDLLVTTNGRVTGCRGVIEDSAREFEATADAVVIASGGINGNLERVRRHWPREWSRPPRMLLNGSHKFADGTLHDAATAIGARITHLDWQWNYAAGVRHWQPRKPDHGLSLVPPKSALWLNWRGERIGPMPLVSGFDTHDLVAQVCRQEQAYSWQLLNRRILLKELAISGAEFNPSFRRKRRLAVLRDVVLGNHWLYDQVTNLCPDVVCSDSLAVLVDRMNALVGDASVDLATVESAARAYDACIDRGRRFHTDEQLRRIEFARRWVGDRVRTCKFQKILEAKAGPLIAIRESIISRKSMGGLQTDLQCRVLDGVGAPIPGLYAAGECAGFGGGGMNGRRSLEGTFLGGSIFGGRIAGREA
jgi:predicted oxidoreductase